MIRSYLVRLCMDLLLFAPVWLLGRQVFLKGRGRRWGRPVREALLFLFAGYLWGMMDLTMELPAVLALALEEGGFHLHGGINLVPLRQLSAFREFWLYEFRVVNVVGNVLVFAPMGFCVPDLWRRRRPVLTGTAAAFLLSLSIEVVQLFSHRATDVDDLILNTAGGLLGPWSGSRWSGSGRSCAGRRKNNEEAPFRPERGSFCVCFKK